jgi:signal transduction histidine kinase
MRAGRTQIAFLVLLVVAVAQVVWWVYDQSRYSRARQEELLEAYEAERWAAEQLFASGALNQELWSEQFAAQFPHLELSPAGVAVRSESVAELQRERRSHVNQYRWEGSFFLAVLLASIWVIRRALLRELELRLRQENFLAAVSHELKSPIASLRLAGDTLARPALGEERRQQLLERNQTDVDRLEDLVTKLLDTSRIEAGGVSLARERLLLAPLVRDLVGEIARESLGRAQVQVEIHIEPELEIHADRVALETVLRNLIANAFVAVGEAAQPRVEVRAQPLERGVGGGRGRGVRIEVSDNGIGFAAGEAERLFEKFYRVGDELRRRSRGTGLGLYLVRRFVELEGGTVKAASPGAGQGAVFRVFWPE